MRGLGLSAIGLIGLSFFSSPDAGVILPPSAPAPLRPEFRSTTEYFADDKREHGLFAKVSRPTSVPKLRPQIGVFDLPRSGRDIAAGLFDGPAASNRAPGGLPDLPDQPSKTDQQTSNVGATEYSGGSGGLAVVPTPASLALIGLGLIGLAYRQRQRFLRRQRSNGGRTSGRMPPGWRRTTYPE